MLQDVDLADGLPMFITIGEREIALIDAKVFRALQNKAATLDAQRAAVQTEHDQWVARQRAVYEITVPQVENTNAD